MKKLSVILAARNELERLLMTVLSAVEETRGLDAEIVLVDNSDPEYHTAVNALLQGQVKNRAVRIIRQEKPGMVVAMETAAREATGEYLFYTDAHTLIGRGAIHALLDFFERHTGEPIGFCHAPIQWAHLSDRTRRTHMSLHRTLLGEWGGCVRKERRITWKGMPHMIRKDTYHAIGGYGCLAEHGAGWGGMRYIGIKPWLLGYENWAIPDGVVYHFGEYPLACRGLLKYRTYTHSGDIPAGWPMAVTAYVFGGEDLLRAEYDLSNMGRFFTGVEQALSEARMIGGDEREWLLTHQKRSWRDLIDDPPWRDN